MYVLISTSVDTCISSLVSVFNDELAARSFLLDHINQLVGGRDVLEAVHCGPTTVKLYRRTEGWVYSTKQLAIVLQLIHSEETLAT